MNKILPIKPSEVTARKVEDIPDAVYDAFNALITLHFSNGSATVRQADVVNLILEKLGLSARQELYDRGWLNVEEAYRAAGWEVTYDKLPYNETYPATFKFSA